MVIIVAPRTGPTSVQQALFQRLEPMFAALEEQARLFIRAQVAAELDASGLVIYSLEIESDAENEKFVLELTDQDEAEIHRVTFKGGVPVHYTVDT